MPELGVSLSNMMRKLFLVLGFVAMAVAETFTIYAVRGTEIPTTTLLSLPTPDGTLSPIGVGSDGATTYGAILSYPSGGSPVAFPARTDHATYIADGSQLIISAVGEAVEVVGTMTSTFATQTDVERCSWGKERVLGTCLHMLDGEPVFTYTGSVVPVYTVTVDNSARGQRVGSRLVITPLVGMGIVLGIVVQGLPNLAARRRQQDMEGVPDTILKGYIEY